MMRQLLIACALMAAFTVSTYADDHDHDHGSEQKEHEHGHEHEDGESEATANVGPDKGITDFNTEDGFKLSTEALKNFELRFVPLNGKGPWNIPASALVYSGEEVNVYRKRSDFFKRIDFKILKKTGATFSVESKDLREGDEVVLAGMGFLRIAELSLSGGLDHGHSH